jgi:catechol 2,3-dioxygenase-like lactoylglutathione lyase family enzyme
MAASDYATLLIYGDPTAIAQTIGGVHRMIAYVTVGADDITKAERFYSAFLPALGYRLEKYHGDLSYILPVEPDQSSVQPEFYVKSPFNGQSASAGNGVMVAFQARSQKQVRDLHEAALTAGGSDEGQPGFRASYSPHFYVAYLRDPHGNKIALFSNEPNEPGRKK